MAYHHIGVRCSADCSYACAHGMTETKYDAETGLRIPKEHEVAPSNIGFEIVVRPSFKELPAPPTSASVTALAVDCGSVLDCGSAVSGEDVGMVRDGRGADLDSGSGAGGASGGVSPPSLLLCVGPALRRLLDVAPPSVPATDR